MNWRRMEDSELTTEQRHGQQGLNDGYYVPDYPKCPMCDTRPEAMHKHLHVTHGWADPGSVFGRIIYHHDTGTFVCSGCGMKASKDVVGLRDSWPIRLEFSPRCFVCGLTFTNAKD